MENKHITTCRELGHRVSTIALNLVLIFLIFIISVFLYWAFKPYNIRYNDTAFETVKQVYEVGEPLTIRTSFCKEGEYEATIYRSLRDGIVYRFPVIGSSVGEGCHDFISETTEIPNVLSGKYIFQVEVIYKPNPLREIKYTVETNEFEIVNK